MTNENDIPDLVEFEKAVLVAMCDAVGYSKKAHVPVEAVQSRFPKHLRGDAETVLKKSLKKQGYVIGHSTGNHTTYELTDEGFRLCKILKDNRTHEL